MEFIFLSFSLMFVLVAIFTKYTKTGALFAIASLGSYFYFSTPEVEWQAVAFVTVGLILVFLEIFIPSFGLIGIVGAASMYWGLIQTTGSSSQAAMDLVLSFIITGIFFIILYKTGAVTKNTERIVLKSTSAAPVIDDEEIEVADKLKVGMTGVAVTALRPTGKVQLESQNIIDAITNGVHLEVGTVVEIEQIIGSKIVVRKAHQ